MKKLCSLRNGALMSALCAILFLASCRKEEDLTSPDESGSVTTGELEKYSPGSYDASIIQPWYTLLNKLIIQSPGHTPPIAARDIGYTCIALYESTTGGIPSHWTLAGQLSGLSTLPTRAAGKSHIPTIAANAALARILKDMFANATAANLATIDSLELALDAQYSAAASYPSADLVRSRDFGHALSDAIFAWSSTDGGHQAYLANFPASYIPPTGPGKWVPTPPAFSAAMLPYWGSNRAFIPADNSSLINPPVPIAFDSVPGSAMYIAGNEVYTIVNGLSQAQKDIANYWADGGGSFTPPGHLISIAAQIVRNRNLNLRDASILLAKVGIGLNDAGIVCWRAKFDNSLMRPITYIRKYIDPSATWVSFIGTPPFPSYTSGHSTFSAVTAKVLTKAYGHNVAFTDSTKIPYGFTPRSFSGFEQAAQEAAVSRLYGGIHYTFDNVNGYNCGVAIELNIRTLRF